MSKTSNCRVLVTGSLAFDFILSFPGKFQDHILADKLHMINLSFLVDKVTKQRGGVAGNIAYTMSLLGETSRIVAAAGHDFDTTAQAQQPDIAGHPPLRHHPNQALALRRRAAAPLAPL